MRKVELLSPAGTMESFYAALLGGCDAVYLAGYLFGARSYAGNFSMEELKEAIYIAHLYGVKVYITVNTMVYENETEMFINYIDELVTYHPDALIIEDIGMFDLIHQRYPKLELHASTQMHLHNKEGVEFAKKIGFKRAVIARETPIEEIKKIREQIDLPIEVFCHGALCISYSGQCLMSSLIGGRSGNRGTCTQCCRLSYTLCDDKKNELENGYLLSTKDLNTLEHIGELIEAGIDSLKIEGRMKRPEYVYYVTSLYRKAIDSYYKNKKVVITKEEIQNLKKLFNRKFTKGFLFSEDSKKFINSYRPNHMGIEIGTIISSYKNKIKIKLKDSVSIHDGLRILGKEDIGVLLNEFYINGKRVKKAYKNDVIELEVNTKVSINSKVVKTTDYLQIETIKKYLKDRKRKIKITGILECEYQKPLKLTVSDGIHQVVILSDQVLEVPLKKPVTKEQMKEKLMRLNDTIYEFEKLEVIGSEGFIPISILNDLRRKMVLKLNEVRTKRENFNIQTYHRDIPKRKVETLKTLYTTHIDNKKIDVLYLDEEIYKQKKENNHVVLKLSNIMKDYPKCEKDVLISEYGSFMHYQNIITNHHFNVANSYAVRFLESLGAKRVTLSLECSKEQIEMLYDAYVSRYHDYPSLEIVVETTPVVMTLKYPLLQKYHYQKGYLKRGNDYFPVIQKNRQTDIYFKEKIKKEIPNRKYLSTRIEEFNI